MMQEDVITSAQGELEATIATVAPRSPSEPPDSGHAAYAGGPGEARRIGLGTGVVLGGLALLMAGLWYGLMRSGPTVDRRGEERVAPQRRMAQPTLSGWGRSC